MPPAALQPSWTKALPSPLRFCSPRRFPPGRVCLPGGAHLAAAAMPAFFDGAQIRDALRNQAMPAIEALAADEHLRLQSLGRFERDHPPSYTSSTDSEELEAPPYEPCRGSSLPGDVEAILSPPMTDEDRAMIAHHMRDYLHPGYVYHRECKVEAQRLAQGGFAAGDFNGRRGQMRFGVVVRRNVRRRWEKLGIWNPAWGFPGRNAEPNDSIDSWDWWWRQSDGFTMTDGKQLVDRALSLRQRLDRGESTPALPRSRLAQNTTASQADSFIISRPWFLFRLEVMEENQRCLRLPASQSSQFAARIKEHVIQCWRDRGDWRRESDSIKRVISWKWRHESPSPEPEGLPYLEPPDDSKINLLDSIEFTPSEVDALEAIELPSSEWPDKFWAIFPDDWPPFFPGQMTQDPPRRRSPSPMSPRPPVSPPRFTLFRPLTPSPREHVEGSPAELQESPSGVRQDASRLPLQTPRRRGPGRPRSGVAQVQKPQHPSAPLRRSARIAAMKRAAEPLPSQAAPSKKPKVGTTRKAAAVEVPQPAAREARRTKARSVPARPPAKASEEAETRPRRGRGRPKVAERGVTKKRAAQMTVPTKTGSGCRGGRLRRRDAGC